MKRLLLIILTLFNCNSWAEDDLYSKVIEVFRSNARSEKAAVISRNISLSENDAAVFWPIFKDYETELSKLGDGKIELVKKYIRHQDKLSDEVARQLITESFELEEKKTSMKRKYFAKFDKVLPSKIAVKFFQLEHRIDLLVDLQIASSLELIK